MTALVLSPCPISWVSDSKTGYRKGCGQRFRKLAGTESKEVEEDEPPFLLPGVARSPGSKLHTLFQVPDLWDSTRLLSISSADRGRNACVCWSKERDSLRRLFDDDENCYTERNRMKFREAKRMRRETLSMFENLDPSRVVLVFTFKSLLVGGPRKWDRKYDLSSMKFSQ